MFYQSYQVKKYADFNTGKLSRAKNAFKRYSFKLMDNAVLGKTIENLSKRVGVRLVTNEEKHRKLTSKSTCISS